jgi:hypothetical protein
VITLRDLRDLSFDFPRRRWLRWPAPMSCLWWAIGAKIPDQLIDYRQTDPRAGPRAMI